MSMPIHCVSLRRRRSRSPSHLITPSTRSTHRCVGLRQYIKLPMYTSEVAAEAAAFVVAPVPYRRERNLIGEIDSFSVYPAANGRFAGCCLFLL